jgi:hypothetical protein
MMAAQRAIVSSLKRLGRTLLRKRLATTERSNHASLQEPRAGVGTEDATESYLALAVIGAMFKTNPNIQTLLDAIGDALRGPPPTLQ